MKTVYSIAVALVVLMTACGGSGAEGDTEPTDDTTTTTTAVTNDDASVADAGTSEAETTTTLAIQALGDGDEDTTFYGNPPGTATVEVGDITYEFDLSILCLSMGGAMGIAGRAADGSAVDVDADFPPEGWETSTDGWEPPSISIDDDERDIRWVSGGVVGETYPEGSSQIESFTNDGRIAFGEASFVNVYTTGDDLQVEQGRFEFSCPEG